MTLLLTRDPVAIRLMIGSSRFGSMPSTYCGVTAVSSTTTATAFVLALTAPAAMSYRLAAVALTSAAMSSRRAASPRAMPFL